MESTDKQIKRIASLLNNRLGYYNLGGAKLYVKITPTYVEYYYSKAHSYEGRYRESVIETCSELGINAVFREHRISDMKIFEDEWFDEWSTS